MEEEIRKYTNKLFPNSSEEKYRYLTLALKSKFSSYKSIFGYNPNENFLICAFFHCLDLSNVELGNFNANFHRPFLMLNYPLNRILGHTETEIFSVLTPYRRIGYDGCGGTIYSTYSSTSNIFNIYEEFDALSDSKITLSEILNNLNDSAKTLYNLLYEFHKETLQLHKNSNINYVSNGINSDQAIDLSKGFSLEHREYMSGIEIHLSNEYFNNYLLDENSDYFYYDDVVASVNSSIIGYMYILLMKDELNKIEDVYNQINNVKGKRTKEHMKYIRNFVSAKNLFKEKVYLHI